MKKKISALSLALLVLLNLNCVKKTQENKKVTNDAPSLISGEFVSFRPAYQIEIGSLDHDYQVLNASWFDVDRSGNLYILDSHSSKLHIFDSQGVHLKTFGNRGQGPQELQSPICFSIRGTNIFVLEQFRGVKIFSLAGEYINYIPIAVDLLASFRALPSGFVGHTIDLKNDKPIMGEPDIREWGFIKLSDNFAKEQEIAKITTHFNFFNNFSRCFVNAVDSEGNIYLPASDDEYVINKFDMRGKLINSFSRKYKRIPYSRELIDWAKRFWKDKIEIPHFPPIVRTIYIDARDLVWVLVGECYLDSGSEIRVYSTVDIFNKDGKFLTTFNSKLFSDITIIKDGRLYSGPNALGDNFIKIYDITYHHE